MTPNTEEYKKRCPQYNVVFQGDDYSGGVITQNEIVYSPGPIPVVGEELCLPDEDINLWRVVGVRSHYTTKSRDQPDPRTKYPGYFFCEGAPEDSNYVVLLEREVYVFLRPATPVDITMKDIRSGRVHLVAGKTDDED